MTPRTLTFLLLFFCLSSGICASLGREITPVEDVPVNETSEESTAAVVDAPVEVVNIAADPVVVEIPVRGEPKENTPVAQAPAADKPVAGKVVADEVEAEKPSADDSPASDDPMVEGPTITNAPALHFPTLTEKYSDTEAVMADMPAKEQHAYMDVKSLDQAKAMFKELWKEENDLTKETQIEDISLKAFSDQEAFEKEPAAETQASQIVPVVKAQKEDSDWGVASIREGLQAANGYFDSLVELMGGRNGVCQYKCKYGKAPVHRHGYVTPQPDGCVSELLGFQVDDSFDLGIPAMTQCCNQLDSCYDTCGSNKYQCDTKYRWCLHTICSDLKKSLGFVSKVKACESVADALYNTVWTLGCRSFMNSQREACYCEGEDRDEL
ncbi:hypothetical protein UPYG_G00131850 [Umbra pygmaea]|uniref:Group XIIB secretory phospholipase A2-like protein n=1 Tax=Umbra pygmaea TaxID=75934 RepID=A0ABD0XBT0_UMBPY